MRSYSSSIINQLDKALSNDNVDNALDHLNKAAEIFEKNGIDVLAEDITSIIEKFAKVKKSKSPKEALEEVKNKKSKKKISKKAQPEVSYALYEDKEPHDFEDEEDDFIKELKSAVKEDTGHSLESYEDLLKQDADDNLFIEDHEVKLKDELSDDKTPPWLKKIREEIPDYEPCHSCGYDHEYEPEEARRFHLDKMQKGEETESEEDWV